MVWYNKANMNKKTIVTILGVVVLVLPFLGFPNSVSTPIFFLSGLGIIFIVRSVSRKKTN